MATLIPAVTSHEIARSIYRDIITGHDYFYVFGGQAFATPDTPEDTRTFLADVHKNIIMAKQVTPGPNDVVYLIRRINWTTDTVYVEYEDNVDLSCEDFYVMTEDYNIYKCLNNNEGAESTVKPTSTDATSSATSVLADGYIWKFMYQVPVLDRIKFLTTDYIPVRNVSDGVNFDVNGTISAVNIDASGDGYTDPYLVIEGDGVYPLSLTFNAGTAVIDADDTIYALSHTFETGDAVLYNTGGGTAVSGLTNNTTYYVIKQDANYIQLASSMANATAGVQIAISAGSGTSHTITDVGNTANISIDVNGGVSSITVINSKRGYTHAKVTMYDKDVKPYDWTDGAVGTDVWTGTITTSVNSKTVTGSGTVFTNEFGSGLLTPIRWTLVDASNRIIGTFDTDGVASNTQITLDANPEFSISNQSFTAFRGGGFQGTVVLTPETSNVTNQDAVLDSVHGAIYKVDIVDGGLGYSAPGITVVGDGENADIDVTVDGSGTITGVTINNPGQNYNYARLEISGVNTNPGELFAHVGPQGGHGANIAKELYASSLCVMATLDTSNVDFFEGNDYRQLGLIKNIKKYNATQDVDIGYFTATTGTAAFMVEVPEGEYDEYNADDEIETSNGGIYKVVSKRYDTTDSVYYVYLLYIEGTETFTTSSTLTNNTTTTAALTCNAVVAPEFDKNTGTILYVNTFSPVSRSDQQVETVKLFLHFGATC